MPRARPTDRTRHGAHRPSVLTLVFGLVVTLAVVTLAVVTLTSTPASADDGAGEPARDARAIEIAERSRDAMGVDTLDANRYLRFNFFGARTHHWDRATGRHRLEGTSREGESYVVVQDLDERTGRVWVDGEELTGDDAASWLERGHGIWINDTYWLLMPAKLLDPGVHLTDEGREEIDGTAYDKVKLTFDSVGLTPGDTYWAWFDTDTGLMHQWAFHLESWEAEREPSRWLWLDWQPYGDLVLSSLRRNVADGTERGLSDIAVFDHLDDAVFTERELPASAASTTE